MVLVTTAIRVLGFLTLKIFKLNIVTIKRFFKHDVGHLVTMRYSTFHCEPTQRKTKDGEKAKKCERQCSRSKHTVVREADTVKQREQFGNEECSNAGGHWHPFSWHASMPRFMIYPGALGHRCEKS